MVDMFTCRACVELDILICRAGQWWICSCPVIVDGVYTHVQWWKYSCAVVDMFMSRAGQLRICSCAVVVNVGYAHV